MNVQKAVKPARDAAVPVRVEQQLVAAVDRAELRQKPFDHIAMEEGLDAAAYATLLAALPHKRFFHDLKHKDAVRDDGSSTRLRMYLFPELLYRLPADQRRIWRKMSRALCSSSLQAAFKRKFRGALEERFGKSAEKI